MQKTITIMLTMLLAALFAVPTYSQNTGRARYRGFTACRYDYETLKELRDKWHANQIRYMICPEWQMQSLGAPTIKAAFEKIATEGIPELLKNCRKLGLAVIVDLHLPPDSSPPAPPKEFKSEEERRNYSSNWWWEQKSNYIALERAWKQLAAITAQFPEQEIWLELFNEPLNWAEFPSAPKVWPQWVQNLTNEIRKIDKTHPLLIATGPGQLWYGFDGWPEIKDPANNLIYTLHMWQPFEYTHQGNAGDTIKGWPSIFGDGAGGLWDKQRLISELHQVRTFQQATGARIHVGEIGVARYAPDGAKYFKDVLDILEEFGWDWDCHGIREATIWSIEYDSRAHVYKTANGKKEDFLKVVKNGMTEKQGLKYMPYTGQEYPECKLKNEMSDRGKVILEYMSRNLEEEKPFSAKNIRSVLVIGNSLTWHAPSADLGWNLNHGMAATRKELDYVHLFYKQLCQFTRSKPQLNYCRINDESHFTGLRFPLPDVADIIVIQLGENFRGEYTKAGFQEPYGKLLDDLKHLYPNAQIFCLGSWKSNYVSLIKAAAEEHGAEFVDIFAISNIDANTAKADGKFSRWEVQWHPGNKGMREIANILWAAVKKKLTEQTATMTAAAK